jgi:hypothetical protein
MAGKAGESGCPGLICRTDNVMLFMHSLQVNVLSVFLLAGLLGSLMAKTAKLPSHGGSEVKPHLVVVTSNRKVY